MAEVGNAKSHESDDPIGQARQGVNWLVGLSGGAIGSAVLNFNTILRFPTFAKIALVGATFGFLASILFGVFYAFQLFYLAERKQTLGLLESKIALARDTEAEQQKADEELRLKGARLKVRNFHHATLLFFGIGGFASLITLALTIFTLPPEAHTPEASGASKEISKVPPLNKYVITSSRNSSLSHSHTFLLDQQTGEVWQLTCRTNRLVEFRRVPKTSYDGSQEEPPVKQSSPGAKMPK